MSPLHLYTINHIFLYLSNHDREDKDSHKVVDELEDHLKKGGGFWDTPNSDQGLYSIVVTANVTKQREKQETIGERQKKKMALSKCDGWKSQMEKKKVNRCK